MKICFLKNEGRHVLTCFRTDGTHTKAEVGPGLPSHDLAHYVAETSLELTGGFFGLIAQGRSLTDLADPRRVLDTGPELGLAEVLARALQACVSGACRPEQFIPMVAAELGPERIQALERLSVDDGVGRLIERLNSLLTEWASLPYGDSLVLDFPDAMLSGRRREG